jgi:hypothetical protein
VSGVSPDLVSIGKFYRHVTRNRFTCPAERRGERDSREPIFLHVPPLEGKELLNIKPMDESIVEFVKSVKIESCRVSNTPHLVFLCGGKTIKSNTHGTRSARDYFYHYIKKERPDIFSRIRLAEDINDWFDEATFIDLLELESYLADTCDLTILFVESPGSIAELGAFAAIDLLCARTLAILNSKYDSTRTFISDGPVRRIRKRDNDLVRYYEWNDNKPSHPSNEDVFEDMSRELTELIVERTSPKEKTFDKTSDGHTMFLIADLINLIGITNESEILESLAFWGYTLNSERFKKYISLLKHLKLIRIRPYSNQIYYLSNSNIPLIMYDFLPHAKNRDRERIKNALRKSLLEKDQRRKRIYQQELSKIPEDKRHA